MKDSSIPISILVEAEFLENHMLTLDCDGELCAWPPGGYPTYIGKGIWLRNEPPRLGFKTLATLFEIEESDDLDFDLCSLTWEELRDLFPNTTHGTSIPMEAILYHWKEKTEQRRNPKTLDLPYDTKRDRTNILVKLASLTPWILLGIIGISFLAASTCSKAESQPQPQLQLHTISYHWSKREDRTYNEVNPGVFLSLPLSNSHNLRFIFGGYRNTYEKITWAIGYETQTPQWHRLSLGAQLGIGTGYEELTGQTLSPIGSIFGQWNPLPSLSIRLSLIPHKEGAIGLSFIFGIGGAKEE